MSRKPMVRIIADAILEAKTPEEKVAVLQKYSSDSLFKRIVKFAINPLVHFDFEDFEPEVSSIGKLDGMGISKFMHIPEDIANNNLNKNEALFAVNMVLSHINDQEVDLFLGMLKKDLKLGLTIDIVNKAWPEHVPEYPIMEPIPYKEELISKWPQIIIQKKYPGKRVNIIARGSKVEFRDDTGKVTTEYDQFADDFTKLAGESRVMFDAMTNGKRFVLMDSVRYDGFVEGSDNRLGYNWRYNGIEHLHRLSSLEKPCYMFPEYFTCINKDVMKEEVTKLGKPCYLRNPAGIWKNGPSNDWLIVSPEDFS